MDMRYWKAGEKVTLGWDYCTAAPCTVVPSPLSEQVADLEQRKAQVEKELADLKAKRDAEVAAKAKAQTYGEKVAEKMVRAEFKTGSLGVHGAILNACGWWLKSANDTCGSDVGEIVRRVRIEFAAALDRAHADGRAEQREKDATMLEQVAAFGYPFDDGKSYSCGRGDAYRAAARIIRDNK
jgi:hypothetical protein